MSSFAIETENLSKRFGQFVAVDSVTFNVQRGTIFGFLGPNGAGKTTTMRMLLGLLKPSGGRAKLVGLRCGASAARGQAAHRLHEPALQPV